MPEPYTPSTDEIRDIWAGARGGYENEPRYRAREAEFDRWLTQITGHTNGSTT